MSCQRTVEARTSGSFRANQRARAPGKTTADTLWKSAAGGFSNDCIHIYDVYLDPADCSILFSSQLGMEVVLNRRGSGDPRYATHITEFIPIQGKEKRLKRISLVGRGTVRAEYKGRDTEEFEVDSGGVTKYVERRAAGTVTRERAAIRDDERYFIDFK